MWCEQRDAEPCYDNFAWFLNGVTDALLAAQNLCVEAEAHGLGICYLGTPNLAQISTRNRYRAEDNLAISRNYFALLKKQGFFNN